MSLKKWKVSSADREIASEISEKFDIDPFVAYLLVERGVKEDVDVAEFLSDEVRLENPFKFSQMEKATQVIEQAVANGELICVYGDFDSDGVTATALLYSYLDSIGANVFFYIPDRESEGYGMNENAVREIASKGVNLIITVDNGISSVKEAELVYSLNMKLIITDHHQIPDVLPKAEAIINPHMEKNIDFKDFSGVGVAFKLVCALHGYTEEIIDEYSDLAAIGTVGDVVDLKGENRVIVKEGLKRINSDSRLGLKAFRSIIGDDSKEYTATDIAFRIVPRINAAGRLDNAQKAVRLLTSEDYEQALSFAHLLNEENTHRRETDGAISADIEEKIIKNPQLVNKRVLVFSGKDYHPGVIGIVAAHFCEKYSKPCLVISIGDDGIAKGSCRSVEGFNIYEALKHCTDVFEKFGGHPLAAGFSLKNENIDLLDLKINEYANTFDTMPTPILNIDCKLSAQYVNLALAESLKILEPYGAGNEEAVFGLYNFEVKAIIPIGENKHLRIEAVKNGTVVKAVMFGRCADEFPYAQKDKIDLAVKISVNNYKGRNYVSLRVLDVRLHGIDDDKYFNEKEIFDKSELGLTKEDLTPSRDKFVLVYSFLKKNQRLHLNVEDLYFRLQKYISYSDAYYCTKVFCECGILEQNKYIIVKNVKQKADLNSTETLKMLKRRAFDGN